jgi:D-amino-acid dehydrogenase
MPPATTTTPDVAIIGGGAIGACIGLELVSRGASVVLLERGPTLASGCSSGNAGIVGASHVLPLAGADAVRDGLRWLGRPDSPFALRPRPAVVPWLGRFLAASTPGRVRQARRVLRRLALVSAELHADLAARGLDTGFERRGLLNVYATPGAFSAATTAARDDDVDGLRPEVLDQARLVERFPHVAPTAAGGVFYPAEAHCDPGAFVRAVGAQATTHGLVVRTGVEALELRHRDDRVESVWTTAGEVRAGQVILAAGAWSAALARDLPLVLPVEGGKGYHVEFDADPGDPEVPTWFQEDRVVVTPMPGRLRVAGTLELAGVDERIDHRRIDAIVRAAQTGLPGFGPRAVKRVWRGLRPCSPDGLPIIGPVPDMANVTVATGHGMWGLQLAPLTGRLVADLVSGAPASDDLSLHALRPERFAGALRSRTAVAS